MKRKSFILALVGVPLASCAGKHDVAKTMKNEHLKMPEFFLDYIDRLNGDDAQELYVWLDTESEAFMMLYEAVKNRCDGVAGEEQQ